MKKSPFFRSSRRNLPAKASRARHETHGGKGNTPEALESRIAPAALLTATKVDVFAPGGDVNGDGNFDPGDTILYTVTVTNAGDVDLTGVTFQDLIDGNTTLGAVNASPLARNDLYTAQANTQFIVGSPTTLSGPFTSSAVNPLANDAEFFGDAAVGTILTSFQSTSTQGGSVSMVTSGPNAGSFSYVPAAGFTGVDTFTYTLRDDGFDGIAGNADDLTSVGTISISVVGTNNSNAAGAPVVWYVDSAYADANGPSDGTSVRPFKSLTPLNNNGADVDDTGDTIFLYESGAVYTAGITLENSQTLIGEGSSLVVNGNTLVTGGTSPGIAPGTGTAITLGSGNTLIGFNVGNAQRDILGTNFGSLTVSNVTLNGTGKALDLNNGSFAAGSAFNSISSTGTTGLTTQGQGIQLVSVGGSVAFGGTTISGAEAQSISVSSSSANINFGNTSIGTGTAGSGSGANSEGIRFDANTAGTRTFGTLTIQNTGTTGVGFSISDTAGTTTITGAASISATTNHALTATGGGAVGFQSLNISNVTGAGSAGIVIGNHTASFTTTGGSITGVVGMDVDIIGGTGTVNIAQNITSTSGGMIGVNNHETGNITFSGNLNSSTGVGIGVNVTNSGIVTFSGASKIITSGTSTAVALTSNSGGTINFTGGGLVITTTSGTGFSATGGGTVSVTGSGNTINSTSGATALNVQGTNIGASNITFQSISSTGGSATGIVLDTTGAAGGLIVTGADGADAGTDPDPASGGTISNKTGIDGAFTTGNGIYLNATSNVRLAGMQLNDFQNSAIRGFAVNGFSLEDSVIGGVIGSNSGEIEGAIAFGHVGPAVQNGLTGNSLIDNVNISGSIEHHLEVYNQSGTMHLTVTNSNIHDNSVASGSDGIQMEFRGVAQGFINIDNNIFTNNKSQAIQISALESSSIHATISSNTITRGTQGNEGIVLTNGGDADLRVLIGGPNVGDGNTISGFGGTAIFVGQVPGQGTAASLLEATIQGNNVTTPSTATNHAIIAFLSSLSGQVSEARLRIDSNTVNYASNAGRAILVDAPDASRSPSFHATVTNNVVNASDPAALTMISIAARNGSTGRSDVRGNDVNFTGGSTAAGINVREATAGSNVLARGASASNDAATVLAANNPLSTIAILPTSGDVPVVENNTITLPVTPTLPSLPLLFVPSVETPVVPESPAGGELPDAPAPQDPGTNPPTVSGPPALADDGILSQEELDILASAAIARWTATGLTTEQVALLQTVRFTVGNLPGWYLGQASGPEITLDADAAGNSWFVDSTPFDDSEFVNGTATSNGGAFGRVDALTTITHELGHVLGLSDTYSSTQSDSLMYGFIGLGERRVATSGLASGVVADGEHHGGVEYINSTLSIGDLGIGKSVTVQFTATINSTITVNSVSNQGTVDSDQTAATLTDDPSVGGAADATVTPVDLPDVTVAISAPSVTEDGAGTLVYTFTREGAATNALTANFSISGTAALSGDFTLSGTGLTYTAGASTGTITFAAGSNTATVTMSATDDTIVEANETVVFTVTPGSTGYDVGTPSVATGTILNDDTDVSVAVAPASVTEDGAGNLVYTFTRTGVTSTALTVNFNVGGTATFSSDYAQTGAATFNATAGTVTFAAGATTATVTIDPTVDTTVEANETAILTVATGAGYNVAGTAATGTINNDDADVTLAVSPSSVTEDGAGNLVYTFTRTGFTTNALTVNFNVGGTATFSTDYSQTGAATFNATAGTVTFAAGATTATVTIDPTADTTVEADETTLLTLAAGSGYNVATPGAVTGTIANDDTDVSVAVAPASVTEDGAGTLVYTFTRNGVTASALTVNFSVGGSATFGSDYAQTGAATFSSSVGTVTFAPGATTATVTLDPSVDTTVEANETAVLTLTAGAGYNVTGSAATGTITNDDTDISVSVAPASVTEDGAGNLVYTFTRTGVTTGAVTVNFNVTGTASLTGDYALTGATTFDTGTGAGTVAFAAGETTKVVTIDPAADSTVEADETAILTVATGAGYNVAGTAATGTISNDDASISLAVSPSSVAEDGAGNLVYTFTRTGFTASPLTVNFSIAGTAVFGSDYSQIGAATFGESSGTVTFAAGSSTATVTIDPTPDVVGEPDETVALTITSGSGYGITTATAVTGTILNDDTAVSVAVSPGSSSESTLTPLVYTFTRTGDTSTALTVNFNVGGTSTLTSDYTQSGAATFTATTGTVVIPIGQSSVAVTLTPVNDTTAEASETAILTVASGSGYSPSGAGSTGTILDNDIDLQITKTDGVTTEIPGTSATYTIIVTNAGLSAVAGASIADTFAAILTNVSYTAVTAGGATGFTASGNGNINDTAVNMPAGATITYTVTGTIVASATGSLVNTATVAVPAGITDPNTANNSATDTDTLTPQGDLSITKTDGKTTLIPGTSNTYTIVVSNSGPSDVVGATLADTFPAGFTGVTFTAVGAGGATGFTASGGGNLNETLNLPSGASVTYTITGNVAANATGSFANTATITAPGTFTDTNGGNNSATDTDTLTPQGDLSVTKTDGKTTLVPGTLNTYTIVVSNSGPSTAVGASLTDNFPAGFTGVTYTAVGAGGASGFTANGSGNLSETLTLPSGSSVTYTVTGTVSSAVTGSFANTATVAAPGGFTDTSSENNSATDTDTLTPQVDLAITKTDGKTAAVPGTANTYTITITNSGPSDAVGATLSDVFPAGFSNATYTAVGAGGASGFPANGSGNINQSVNLPSGASITYTVSGTILASATGTLVNTATISAAAGTTDTAPGNNSATDTDTLTPQADLAITKTDGVTSVVPGTQTTYTIVVSNSGPSDTAATVADTFPASLSNITFTAVGAGGASGFSGGSGNLNQAVTLPSGGSITYTVTGTVNAGATGSLSNTATVTATGGTTDPNAGNNSATDTDTLTPQGDLAITKTDGVTTLIPGASTTYTIVVSNSGPSNVVGANVADLFPASLGNITFTAVGAGGSTGFTASGSGNLNDTVNIPAGGSITYTVNGTVASSATGTLANTATITAPGTFTDTNPGNNSATDTDTLTPQADLAVSKTDSADPVVAGTSLTYTITLANNGLSDAVNVSLADTLPAGTTFVSLTTPGGYTAVTPAVGAGGTVTISASSLPAGGFATFSLVVLTSASVPQGTILSNTATVTSSTTDPTSENNSATATTAVTTQADLSITKVDSVDPLFIGSNLTYTLNAVNAGASDAQNVTITDAIPAGMTFVSASAPAGWIASTPAVGANGTVTFTKTSFAAGGSESLTIVVAPTAGVGGTTISNTATIASATTDPTSENNSDTETTFVAGVDLTITKTDNFTVTTPGSTLTYVLSYSNAGSSVATGVVITETLPAGTTFSATQNPGWVQVGSTNQYTYAIPSVAAGASGTVNFVAVVDSVVAAGLDAIDNASSITDDGTHGTDIVPADNSATDTTTLDAAPDLVVSIVDDVATAVRGGIVTYTISYSNEGNQDATGVVITQTLPANTFFDFFASSSGWSQTGANTFEYTVGSLDGGGTSGSVDFAVRVASSLPGGYLSLVTTSTIADDLANGADLTIADNTDSESTLIYQGIYVVSPGISLPGRFAPPAIRVFDIATGTEFSINAYESTYRNSIRVATGDINGDGYDDIITSTITGNGRVRVFDGVTGERFTGAFSEIAAFTERGARGAFVASGDVTGDGRDDIIVGSGYAAAGTAKVRVFDGRTGASVITTEPFGTRFHGGVRVATGDVNGDGVAEIIASQGFGGNDVVVSKLRNNEVSFTNEVLRTIEVGGSRYRGGVFVAAAEDLNNDGKADLIVGRDRGQTIIETFNGDTGVLLSTITPFSAAYKLGVRVAAADVNLDGVADIIAGSGGRNGSLVKFFDGVTNTEITGRSFAAFPAFPTGAIFVAGTSPVPSLGKRNIEA